MSIGLHFPATEFLKDRAGPYLTLNPHCPAMINTQYVCRLDGWIAGRTNTPGEGIRAEPGQVEGGVSGACREPPSRGEAGAPPSIILSGSSSSPAAALTVLIKA